MQSCNVAQDNQRIHGVNVTVTIYIFRGTPRRATGDWYVSDGLQYLERVDAVHATVAANVTKYVRYNACVCLRRIRTSAWTDEQR